MIVLVLIGNIAMAILETLSHQLEEAFGQRIQIGNSVVLP